MFSWMTSAIGNGAAFVISPARSFADSRIARMKMAPMRPDSRIADRMPRGAWRLASRVSSPYVPAVSKPYTTKSDMNAATANTGR
jgi:hypothetical protein